MHWNYRFIQKQITHTFDDTEEVLSFYELHEVYYEGKTIVGWCETSCTVFAENGKDMKIFMKHLQNAYNSPALKVSEDGKTLVSIGIKMKNIKE